MTKSTIGIISALFIVTLLANCTTVPQLTPMQKREITTRLLNSNYDNTFRATLSVLQDQGYIIKNTDMNTGLINAIIDRQSTGGSQFAQALLLGYVADKGSEIDASFMISSISDTQTEIRLNLQESKYGQTSSWSSSGKTNVKQILDPEIFSNLFNAIQFEVSRREAMNPNP